MTWCLLPFINADDRMYLHGGSPTSYSLPDMQDRGVEKGQSSWYGTMYRYLHTQFGFIDPTFLVTEF